MYMDLELKTYSFDYTLRHAQNAWFISIIICGLRIYSRSLMGWKVSQFCLSIQVQTCIIVAWWQVRWKKFFFVQVTRPDYLFFFMWKCPTVTIEIGCSLRLPDRLFAVCVAQNLILTFVNFLYIPGQPDLHTNCWICVNSGKKVMFAWRHGTFRHFSAKILYSPLLLFLVVLILFFRVGLNGRRVKLDLHWNTKITIILTCSGREPELAMKKVFSHYARFLYVFKSLKKGGIFSYIQKSLLLHAYFYD